MRHLSADLRLALQEAEFGRICAVLFNNNPKRAFGLAFLITSLPSALPLPAPGYSTPFGILILILCFQMMRGKAHPWIPNWAGNKVIPENLRNKALEFLVKVVQWAEILVKPRFPVFTHSFNLKITILVIAGLAALMVLPIPGTNTLPAFIIFWIGLSLSEDDGLAVFTLTIVGGIAIILYLIALYYIFELGLSGVGELIQWIKTNAMVFES
ncbi:MAG: exopolysaccharide biosynthesis protein [Bdellovibrionaceae bacterium]|nr:exopolysaccharide biosynthesis protein [Pseudobdellovibrionaceae bacterium]MDW8190329.1 exopolysaccharide biosynthesis protein [Pseudobdellovibrionaceae bacterium]